MFAKNLPVYNYRQEIIIDNIAHQHAAVISGGEGSGKATQLL